MRQCVDKKTSIREIEYMRENYKMRKEWKYEKYIINK